jgi:cytochrome c553
MRFIAPILVFAAAACGSKTPAASTTPAPSEGSAAAEVVLPDVPFAQLDHAQQVAFMKQKVMPVMKPLFQNHDAKAFEKFGCSTCHGAQAKQGKFDMPNPGLPKLDFKDMSKFKKEDIEWMHNDVWPAMAKVLNAPMYSDTNPTGFGCLACHTEAGK